LHFRVPQIGLALLALALAFGVTAPARPYGSDPVPVSAAGSGGANGASGGAAISGDNRVARYVAFHSLASNLVPGDTNGVQDVFVYARETGQISRVSVSSGGAQANGASANPALDGSVQRAAHCVAFQSQATNLVPGVDGGSWRIYVRDLQANRTRLVSRGVSGSAVDPAISGDCRQVAFTSAGRIYIGNGLRGGRAHYFALGTNPALSRDGSAITWERGHGVWLQRDGHTTQVAAVGTNPQVTDAGASRIWGVAFDTPQPLVPGDSGSNWDVYMRTFKATGGVVGTDLISGRNGSTLGGDSHNGGITAYAWQRGIVVFETTIGQLTTLWYKNRHTGNIDDLAYAPAAGPNQPGITGIASSARANYVVFSSRTSFLLDSNGPAQNVFLKYLGQ
jgi:hypothetical protein